MWLLLTSFVDDKLTEFMQCLGILLVFVPENNVKQSKVIGMNNKRKGERIKYLKHQTAAAMSHGN